MMVRKIPVPGDGVIGDLFQRLRAIFVPSSLAVGFSSDEQIRAVSATQAWSLIEVRFSEKFSQQLSPKAITFYP